MSTFNPTDFVYVDTENRKVIGLVEWDNNGNPKKKEKIDDPEGKEKKLRRKKQYYVWGSYATMAKLYKLEGKVKDKDTEDYISLETAVEKLQEEPYW